METMNAVITVDDNYIRPALIMLESLFESNPSARIWLLYSNVSDENIDRLSAHVRGLGGEFTALRVGEELFANAPTNKYFTREMYYRLLIPELLPQEEQRALYLDPDIIIMENLDDFYNTDFEGKLLVAVPDIQGDAIPERRAKLGLGEGFHYVNSGVLLFNIPAMRGKFRLDDLLSFLGGCEIELEFPDQDLINLYFRDDIKYAPRRYNFSTEYVDSGDFARYVLSPSYRRSEDVAIAHYMGKCKPWEPSYYYKYYGKYRRRLKKYLTACERRRLALRPLLVAAAVIKAAWRVVFSLG